MTEQELLVMAYGGDAIEEKLAAGKISWQTRKESIQVLQSMTGGPEWKAVLEMQSRLECLR